ncbi:MAG: hypothetical protein HOP96_09895 [Sphingomonas sp.]|nr:hypothetical protein [Sphingomonas sp.]
MERFQIRYFRDSHLEKVETLEAPDLLEVIDRACPPEPEVVAEIWSKVGKVGMIGPMPELAAGEGAPCEEAEIAEVMKSRLRLVRG